MTRRVTGTLYGPASAAVADATLRFVAQATSASGVPQGVSASVTTDEAGVYDVTLLPGYYAVHLSRGSATTLLGRAVVATGEAITLPGLLSAQTVPEPAAVELTARVEALEQTPPGSGIAEVVAGDGIEVDANITNGNWGSGTSFPSEPGSELVFEFFTEVTESEGVWTARVWARHVIAPGDVSAFIEGGDPEAGTAPTLELTASNPFHVGASTAASAGSAVTLLHPSDFVPTPAVGGGFATGIAA